jgi:hypothetical protein
VGGVCFVVEGVEFFVCSLVGVLNVFGFLLVGCSLAWLFFCCLLVWDMFVCYW